MTDIKKDFPVYEEYPDLVYLDNSATQQKPRSVLRAVEKYYKSENANPMRGMYELSVKATEAYENAREAVRKFINAESTTEIVFTRNASESLNLIAYSYGRQNVNEGDEILVAISEHHSNLLPWQMVAREKGAKLNFLECGEDGLYTVESLKSALTPKTKIFAIAQVSNICGMQNPIKKFAEVCHKNGTIIICDGAQSVSHMPVDVRDMDVDFFAFSGHKMLAPMGIGVLYGKEQLLDKMPPFLYGGEMIEYVTRESATFAELPHKFEAGTVNAGGAVGLHAAIDYINKLGFDFIVKREEELTKYAFDKMKAIPHVNILGSDKGEEHHGILTFTIDGVHPHDIAEIFGADGVSIRAGHHCAQPLHQHLDINSTARMSIAFYNDESDVDKFIATLETIRRRMGYDR